MSQGLPTAVLARDNSTSKARDRIAERVAFWSERLGVALPMPVVLAGDVGLPDCGLGIADRSWLSRSCRGVLHSAANLTFVEDDGEPWHTNVTGTRTLLDVAARADVNEWHHVSTAFVCGKRTGVVSEDDELDCSVAFNNDYEESKCAAEMELRRARGLRLNVYRPTVILGDSQTGYTNSYTGFYRVLEMASRVADIEASASRGARPSARKALTFRLPFRGDEAFNLVTVDWVAEAIGSLCEGGADGRTYHLTAHRSIRLRDVVDVAADELGVAEAKYEDDASPQSPWDAQFAEAAREYWPYLAGMPDFRSCNLKAALPNLRPAAIDADLIRRLIRFAVSQKWGRPERRPSRRVDVDCANYIEKVFPSQAARSGLAREMGLDVMVGIEISGGKWLLCWKRGELVRIRRGSNAAAPVVFRTDTATFWELVQNRITPHRAFFEQKVAIDGDIEMGLKLATLFGRFLEEQPLPLRGDKEQPHAAA